MNKYFDFDQFMAEKEEKPLIIKIFGEEEELPSSLPADLVLKIIAMQRDKNRVISEAEMFEMATKVFGDKLDKWCQKGLTVSGLEVLFTQVLRMYTQSDKPLPKESGKGKSTP
jgi:hypothetical protein